MTAGTSLTVSRSPEQHARTCTGVLAAFHRDLAGVDRRLIALGPLDETRRAAWEIRHELWAMELQAIEVDDVHVGLHAWREDTSITQSEQCRCRARELVYRQFERNAVMRAIACP